MKNPKVYVKPKAWSMMSYWARLGGRKSREFTCFGRAVFEHGVFCVTDVYLVKQEGTSGGVDGDEEDINRLMVELYEKGIEPDEAFRCWIHSHPGSGSTATYLSGTDEENIERYLTGAFLISIVLDKNGDHPYCRVDLKEPRWSVEADLEVDMRLTEEERKAAEEEFKEKSKAKAYTVGSKDWPRTSYYDRGDSYSSGKRGGVAPKKRGGSGKGGTNGERRRDYDETDMFLYGLNAEDMTEEELRMWEDYLGDYDYGVPNHVTSEDTDEVEVIEVVTTEDGQLELAKEMSADSMPEWVVQMADAMAITVEDLRDVVDLNGIDRYIDEIVRSLQIGHRTMDDAVDKLVKLGFDKSVAQKELETRANA